MSWALERVLRLHGNDTNSCWPWPGGIDDDGYGRIWINGRYRRAHRFIYELLVGPIPSGFTLDHECNNRPCVNPTHTIPATFVDNAMRGNNPCAVNARKTICVNGHLLDIVNTYIRHTGKRNCRKCGALAANKQRRVREQRAACVLHREGSAP